jgi:hypothetical protein
LPRGSAEGFRKTLSRVGKVSPEVIPSIAF